MVQTNFIRALTQVALDTDYTYYHGGATTEETILSSFARVADSFGLKDLFTEALWVSNSSEGLSNLVPALLTVHKAQGSQWRRVVFIAHQSQRPFRELIYTAITRAMSTCVCITHGELWGPNESADKRLRLSSGVVSQRIKGVTLDEKISSFNELISSANSKREKAGSQGIDIDALFEGL